MVLSVYSIQYMVDVVSMCHNIIHMLTNNLQIWMEDFGFHINYLYANTEHTAKTLTQMSLLTVYFGINLDQFDYIILILGL